MARPAAGRVVCLQRGIVYEEIAGMGRRCGAAGCPAAGRLRPAGYCDRHAGAGGDPHPGGHCRVDARARGGPEHQPADRAGRRRLHRQAPRGRDAAHAGRRTAPVGHCVRRCADRGRDRRQHRGSDGAVCRRGPHQQGGAGRPGPRPVLAGRAAAERDAGLDRQERLRGKPAQHAGVSGSGRLPRRQDGVCL